MSIKKITKTMLIWAEKKIKGNITGWLSQEGHDGLC